MSNPKKIDLAALLDEDAAPTNPRICYEPERGNFALPGDVLNTSVRVCPA